MFKINSQTLKNLLRIGNLKKIFFSFFSEWSKALILSVAVLGTLTCVYVWYFYVYNPSWSDEQKTAYKKTKDTGTTFDQNKFDSAISKFKARQAEIQKPANDLTDIFRLKQ